MLIVCIYTLLSVVYLLYTVHVIYIGCLLLEGVIELELACTTMYALSDRLYTRINIHPLKQLDIQKIVKIAAFHLW